MSFDGLFTRAMVMELANQLTGGRISKIYQPYPNELIIIIRSQGKNVKLLLSAHPTYARIQLTNEEYEYPKEPSMFCMLLRKYLEGAIIEKIEQQQLDRIIKIEVKGKNEIGDISYKQLIIEIMGRHSNIILVDKERQVIHDSIKHVSSHVNRYRTILPGQSYILPPQQDKVDPFSMDEEDILKEIDFNSGKIDQQLVNRFMGVSPLFAKEVLFLAGLPYRTTISKTFLRLIHKLKNNEIQPSLIKGEQKEVFYFFPLKHLKGEIISFSSLSEMLDHYYYGRAERERVKQIAFEIEKFIKNEKEKNEKKLEKLKETLKDAENSQKYQLYGELLTAHMHLINKGMTEITVENYYDGSSVTIPLDPKKTPAENAQQYFTKYQKAKNAQKVVKEQMEQTEAEIKYFDLLLQQIQLASPKDIEEIKEELMEQGILKAKHALKKQKNKKEYPKLEEYISSDGTTILVGKNNKQNEYLTMKLAKKEEIWLHAKDIPGSHVVIKHQQPSEQTIIEAAMLAAYFSKARNSSSVPVDYTKIKYVRKPPGKKPGFVIYDHQKTIFVTPSVELVTKMRKQ